MSTALTSTRIAAPAANALIKSGTKSVRPGVAPRDLLWKPGQSTRCEPHPLVTTMHRKLYPHLYEADGTPRQTIEIYPKTERVGRWEALVKKHRGVEKMSVMANVPRPAPPIKKTCPDPVATVTASQIALLDPTGARTRLFDRSNPECARVGDILLVRLRTGDPFAGVCINIRRRGVDTAILLRGQLTRVGVEMWYKVYSPLVEGIEVVQRAQKRARRARLTYMRKVKHDRGSVEGVVRMYLRQKAALGSGGEGGKKKAAAMAGGKKAAKRGKKR